MYLQQLREEQVSHTNWPITSNQHMLNVCFDIADATLNSWKEAHDIFHALLEKERKGLKNIDVDTHQAFTRLVVKAFKDEENADIKAFATNTFPSECIAYALLLMWVGREAMVHKVGDTVRSTCGSHRTTYQPDWSPAKPWATFNNGTACNAFATLSEAKRHLMKDHGAVFKE